METLYRKVQFEIREKDHDQIRLIGKNANFIFNPNTINGEELSGFLAGCEEVPNNSHQIEKLEAENKELLEALERSNLQIKYLHEKFIETGSGNSILSKNQSIIQKMKKCQENTPR